ncbi:ATP-binding protein [Streptomyces sp. NPDC057245]|uniref:ATP-binding protein n=1 Tax=Streptomyces sp. NPDC057245 TaxID=3346065 RepID=UPI00362D7E9A
MPGFVGRTSELATLNRHLDWVREGRGDQPGRALLLRGRRRVGKSRLVDLFCERAQVPHVVHQATRGEDAQRERARFLDQVRRSSLPDTAVLAGVTTVGDWDTALRQLAAVLPDDSPSVVVLDELPWMLEGDSVLEGTLQTVWDRVLSRKPVLLVLIGSDLAMMEQLSAYGRPFHQRGVEMVLAPLSPAEVMAMTGLSAADAFDAHLLTGGLPLVCQEWREGESRTAFLSRTLNDPTSPLLVSAERALAAEFPAALQARHVLSVIGSGERTFGTIASKAGAADRPLPPGSLNQALRTLTDKRLIAVDTPLSARPGGRDRRYRVADPYLRFWLAFLEEGISEIERGRGRIVVEAVERGWTSWRGRAIEPVVRDSLSRLLPDADWPQVREVGGWWPRTNNPEVDLVGADRSPARKIGFVGSVKWHESGSFDHRALASLTRDALAVPGADEDTPLIAVSRSGFTVDGLAATYGPEHLMEAWTSDA